MLTSLLALSLFFAPPAAPESLWLEAETFEPLKGANFSFMPEVQQTKGSWAVAGPDTAASWTQGGESEWMSVAIRADEPGEKAIGRETEVPAAGEYTLWVRYSDYREKKEVFGIRVSQGGKTQTFLFGEKPVVDELDPMKLLWDWSFAWDRATVTLQKGPAKVEIFTTGPSEARRCVDCLCFTTDERYHPGGREKPDAPVWSTLRGMRTATDRVEPLTPPMVPNTMPSINTSRFFVRDGPPAFVWNVAGPWAEELKKPIAERVDSPFSVDPPLLADFLAAFKGKQPPIYSSPLSGPVIHIPAYPAQFAKGSPFLDWLDRHPKQRFAILLNYGEPAWPSGTTDAQKQAVYSNLARYGDRFVGFIAGENIAYAAVENAALEAAVRKAKSRGEVLEALREAHTKATKAKFASYYGMPVTYGEAWGPVISCLSASMEAYSHALCSWGVKRIGHENTGNSPTLARRLAFLRGAARQFGTKMVDYQSCNLGDSATMFSREAFFFPGSSRYVIDNSYDVWAGAGTNWLLKDYFLWHLAGVDAFYNEQGVDLFWKPGGGSAGDSFPVQLSPKGKIAEAMQRIAAKPRGTQVTPIAFLLDEAHGWSQERFEPGSFALNPELNPAVLRPGRHEASIRGWFDVAYFPAPETQDEPASGVRQTYVNGIFGDIFDVIVTTPKKAAILASYPVVVLSGEVTVSAEWGKALKEYVDKGGTLVVCDGQVSGPGVAELGLPKWGNSGESGSFTWSASGQVVASNRFRYRALPASSGRVLATAEDGSPIAAAMKRGKGQLIVAAIPLGLGIDDRPTPLSALLLRNLAQGLLPVTVKGDVEWTLNRLDDGGWLVGILNNRGVIKPQHGVTPTAHNEAQPVSIYAAFGIEKSEEWIAGGLQIWTEGGGGAQTHVTVPAGAVRLIEIRPRK